MARGADDRDPDGRVVSGSGAGDSRQAPPAFHVLIKPRGAICNLSCRYCYFLSKDRLYPDSAFRMTVQVLESLTQQYIEAQQVPEVTFGWQGGEPTLMGLDFFRRAVELQRQYRRPGLRVLNALQTNGTTLDEEWCRFFREHGFLIGLSLDGPRELHDVYRADRAGGPTFDRVMAGAELLREHRVEFNILATINAANAGHPLEVYRFFRDKVGARFVQFIPIVERDNVTGYQEGDRVTPRSVTGAQYGAFLNTIFDEWVRHDVGRFYVQMFDVALGIWAGQAPALCVLAPTCGTALVLEHNGDLYACDHFVEPRHRLGQIQETSLVELVGSAQQRCFGLAKRDALPRQCRECPVLFACNGACPKDRLLTAADGEPGLNYLCDGYRAFFTHIDRPMRVMAGALRAGRAPANIMLYLAREEAEQQARLAHAGRNDPCPCGSGRKYKQCHGRLEQSLQ